MSAPAPPTEPVAAPGETSDEKSKKLNSLALAGVCFGLLSFIYVALGVTPILGIVFSTLGIATFDEKTEKMRWMAAFGLGLSILVTLLHFQRPGA